MSAITQYDLAASAGEIPKALGDITSLTRLDLQFNQLTGEVCEELRNLTKLQTLCLNGNEFRRYIGVYLHAMNSVLGERLNKKPVRTSPYAHTIFADTDAAKEVLQKQLPSCSMNF